MVFTMQKKGLLALLLALMMILSGCALVSVDEEKDNARVIVDVNGETLTKQVVHAAVDNQVQMNQYYNQLYASYGLSGAFSTDEDQVANEVISSYVEQLVLKQKAKELGLDQPTEEEQATVDKNAKEIYDSFLQSVISTYFAGTDLEGDALNEAAEKYVAENEVKTADGRSTLADFTQTALDQFAEDQAREYAVKDVTVSEEEIKADYDAKVEAAKTEAETNPNAYGQNLINGTAVYYAPAGYRMVKHILVPFSEEDKATLTEKQKVLTDAQDKLAEALTARDNAAEDADKDALQAAADEAQGLVSSVQADYDQTRQEFLAKVKVKADEIYALATAEGADFDALIAEYSTDSMPAEGYAVREGYTYFVDSFVAAAMALQNPGDISEPVESTYGYHIIQYVSDVAEGPVDLETVRSSIESSLLSTKKDTVLADTIAQWISEANVKTYPERLHH